MTQNVVTYTVEISTDNSDGKLLPYMTANINFEVSHETGVLLVPNAALRYTPQDEEIAPDARNAQSSENSGSAPSASSDTASANSDQSPPARHGPTSRSTGGSGSTPHEHGTLWTRDGQFVRPIRVRVGLSDGTNTEVQGQNLNEGTEIVMGDVMPTDGATAAHNPFIPQFGNRNRNGGNGGGGGGGGGGRGGGGAKGG
jgi:HlyD family secretion protein